MIILNFCVCIPDVVNCIKLLDTPPILNVLVTLRMTHQHFQDQRQQPTNQNDQRCWPSWKLIWAAPVELSIGSFFGRNTNVRVCPCNMSFLDRYLWVLGAGNCWLLLLNLQLGHAPCRWQRQVRAARQATQPFTAAAREVRLQKPKLPKVMSFVPWHECWNLMGILYRKWSTHEPIFQMHPRIAI